MTRTVVAAVVLAPFTIGAAIVLRWAAAMFPPELNEIEEGLSDS